MVVLYGCYTAVVRPMWYTGVEAPVPDEPVWSAKRILTAMRWWLWYHVAVDHGERGAADIPFWYLVRTFHRPYANRDRY